MLKKIICGLLVAVMLLSLVACGSTNNPPEQTSDDPTSETDAGDETGEAETEDTEGQFSLPDKNWGKREFTMLCRKNRISQFYQDGESTNQLDQAVYERNCFVEETYGVVINCITTSDGGTGNVKGAEFNERLTESSMSGCTDYDVVAPDYYWGCETKGYFTNLYELDYLNFSAPWWWSSWNDCFTINGTLTSAVGWLTLDVVQGMEVVYFNKQMMEDLGFNDVYSLVYDKEWTLEQMIQMGEMATQGVNADGTTEDNYVYGTILHYIGLRSMVFGLGTKFASYGADGSIKYEFASDKNLDVASKLTTWVYNNPEVFYCAYGDIGHGLGINENPTETATMFASNHALFYCYGIKTAELLASMDVKYGVLPPPLNDSTQEDYITTTFGTSFFAIERGRTEEQKEFASFILEALNYYSYTMVKDVYYEKTLKLRYASDAETRDMIDLVVNNAYLDFAYLTSNYTGNLMGSMESCIVTNTSLTTKWEEIGTAALEKLSTYLEGYLK